MSEQSRMTSKSSTTSTTLTKRRFWRRADQPASWWPWGILPIAGLAILFLLGAAFIAPDIQAEVRASVGKQLSRAGAAVGSITADGQRVSARVAGTNYDTATLAALGEATRCSTWAGELRCPSQVAIEQDMAEGSPALAEPANVAIARAQFESTEASGLSGTFDVQALRAEAPSEQNCDDRFANVLDRASIQFRTNSAEIDTASEPLLAELAGVARTCSGRMTIAGHTDSRGDAAMNDALSLARAAAVRDAFARLGIDTEHMTAVGLGETQPVADNVSAEGRARNRRITISMDPTQ